MLSTVIGILSSITARFVLVFNSLLLIKKPKTSFTFFFTYSGYSSEAKKKLKQMLSPAGIKSNSKIAASNVLPLARLPKSLSSLMRDFELVFGSLLGPFASKIFPVDRITPRLKRLLYFIWQLNTPKDFLSPVYSMFWILNPSCFPIKIFLTTSSTDREVSTHNCARPGFTVINRIKITILLFIIFRFRRYNVQSGKSYKNH